MVKKILILSYNYYPDLSPASYRIKSLIEEFEKNHHNIKITLLTTTPIRYDLNYKKIKSEYLKENIEIIRFKIPKKNFIIFNSYTQYLLYFFKVLFFCRNKKYDLVFSTTSKLMTGFLGALISKYLNAKFYLDIRDIFYETIKYNFSKSKFIKYYLFFIKKIENYALNSCSSLSINSEGFYNYFKMHYPDKEIDIFTNGIDNKFLLQSWKRNNFEKKINVLYAGNLGNGQALHKIIPELVKLLNDNIKFKIIGSGNKKKLLYKKLEKLKIHNYQLIAPVSQEILINEYLNSNILFLHLDALDVYKSVLPSKIFEYACTGRPIVAGVSGYSSEFLIKNISGSYVFEPCDHLSAAKIINSIDKFSFNREDFKKKFLRTEISSNFVKKIISTLNDK